MARKPAKAALPKKSNTVRRPRHQDDVAPPYNKPKLLRHPPKLTAKELLQSVWAGDKERSADIAVKQVKRVSAPKKLEGYIAYRIATYNKVNKHIHRITLLFDGRVGPNSKLIVDSDTFRHVFYYEYALARRGNAFIYRSNGDPAIKTNPRNKAGIDKHVYVALRYVLRAKRYGELK